jgi:threonine aldolase
MLVDLRSDTVTRPTPPMREAMASAEVGDDVYGEDPTVAVLEQRVAALLGQEAAVFTPTGSMANQLGLRSVCPIGKELLCDDSAHVVRAELGAAAALSGITTRTYAATRGLVDVDRIAAMMRPDAGPHLVSTSAVVVENTHNFGGGTVQPLDDLRRLREVTRGAGVLLHLDGARLWNAHVASGTPLSTYGEMFDTVSVCLSKGLGAPIGSVLAASADRVAAARVWRKRLGGGMRQVGILAAAGLYALEHHVDRLADDHARARRLAEAMAEARPGCVDAAAVETNIVVVELPDVAPVVARAREHDVLVSGLDATHLRVVTHLDVDDDGVDRAAKVLSDSLRETARS